MAFKPRIDCRPGGALHADGGSGIEPDGEGEVIPRTLCPGDIGDHAIDEIRRWHAVTLAAGSLLLLLLTDVLLVTGAVRSCWRLCLG